MLKVAVNSSHKAVIVLDPVQANSSHRPSGHVIGANVAPKYEHTNTVYVYLLCALCMCNYSGYLPVAYS